MWLRQPGNAGDPTGFPLARSGKPRLWCTKIMVDGLSRTETEALKAIYRIAEDAGAARTGDLAEALGLSPGSVTPVLKRLADADLVSYRPYRGVKLTTEGLRAAVAAIRRHRIVERFLADMLGYPWPEADRLAPTFEHELPAEIEHRLYVALDRPATCPHGFPIPDAETTTIPFTPPLYDLEPGEAGTLAVPGSLEPEVADFLDTLGIRPGVEVEVREKLPFDGPIVVRVDGSDRTLGEKLARRIFVRKRRNAADAGRRPLEQGRPGGTDVNRETPEGGRSA